MKNLRPILIFFIPLIPSAIILTALPLNQLCSDWFATYLFVMRSNVSRIAVFLLYVITLTYLTKTRFKWYGCFIISLELLALYSLIEILNGVDITCPVVI